MDKLKELLTKLMLGTVARGIMWVFAFIAGKIGVESPDQSSVDAIAAYVIAVGLAVVALFWSKKKDSANLAAPPK